jgi:hypothetical protein
MLTLMTVATGVSRYFPEFLQTSRAAGIRPVVLGRGRRWRGFGMRLALLRKALAPYRRSKDLILFADAYDSIVVHSPETIEQKYRKIGAPLVFTAEVSCFPDPWKRSFYPPARGCYKFLNGGGYIGEIRVVYGFLRQLDDKHPYWASDQRWWTDRFLANQDTIALDTRCTIFQTLCNSMDDLCYRDGVYNKRTRTYPSVLHGNGWVDMTRVLRWHERATRPGPSLRTGGSSSRGRTPPAPRPRRSP